MQSQSARQAKRQRVCAALFTFFPLGFATLGTSLAAAQFVRDDLWVATGPVKAAAVSSNTLYLGVRSRRSNP